MKTFTFCLLCFSFMHVKAQRVTAFGLKLTELEPLKILVKMIRKKFTLPLML
jgi:hypothetical protein